MELSRRKFLGGAAVAAAAPVLAKAASLLLPAGDPVWIPIIAAPSSMSTDFSTDNLLVKSYERYTYVFADQRFYAHNRDGLFAPIMENENAV